MHRTRTQVGLLVLCFACLLYCIPPEARAGRPPENTVAFWVGYADWSGENARSFAAGPATGATLLFHIGLPVAVGLEAGFARMDTDQVVGEVDEFTLTAVVRYRFAFIPGIRPFVGLQGGYTRLSADLESLRFEQNGGFGGGNAGFEIPAGQRVMLTCVAGAQYHEYRDTTFFLYDVSVPSTGGGAWRYWGRLGLSFRWAV